MQSVKPDLRLVLVGGGIEVDRLQRYAAQCGAANVRFVPRQPPEQVVKYLAAADALLIHLKDDPLCRIGVPSKTQTCLAAGRPIVIAASGDAPKLVLEAGAGVACEPENAASLAEAILRLASLPEPERRLMGERGRRFYETRMSFRSGLEKIEATLASAGRSQA